MRRKLLGPRRLVLNDNQRRRLAMKGMSWGRKLLGAIGSGCTPGTILRGHRQLVAENWDRSQPPSVRHPVTEQAFVQHMTGEELLSSEIMVFDRWSQCAIGMFGCFNAWGYCSSSVRSISSILWFFAGIRSADALVAHAPPARSRPTRMVRMSVGALATKIWSAGGEFRMRRAPAVA